MDWININQATLRHPLFLAAEPHDKATWLHLQAYCHSQENAGRIAGARQWTARMWMMAAFVTPEDVNRPCGLWRWDEEDLLVEFYPLEKEKAVVAGRKGGAKGARNRWHKNAKPHSQPSSLPNVLPNSQPSSLPNSIPYAEGNGRERKGIEKKEEEKQTGSSSSMDVCVPSLKEVQAWASEHGVDPAYAQGKWHEANEGHWWVQNGALIDWQSRWLRFWLEDRGSFQNQKKNGAARAAVAEFRLPEDPPDYWTDDPERLNGQLFGLSQDPNRQKEFFRLREVLNFRRKHGL